MNNQITSHHSVSSVLASFAANMKSRLEYMAGEFVINLMTAQINYIMESLCKQYICQTYPYHLSAMGDIRHPVIFMFMQFPGKPFRKMTQPGMLPVAPLVFEPGPNGDTIL